MIDPPSSERAQQVVTLAEIEKACQDFNDAVDKEDVLAGTVFAAVCAGVLERIRDQLRAGAALRSSIPQTEQDHSAGLAAGENDTGTRPTLPASVSVENQQTYSDYFGEKAEGFADELARVPRDRRRKVRYLRDAHFAAAMALREDVPLLDKDTNTWVVKHTIMACGRTRTEATRALASAVGLTASTWPSSSTPTEPV